MKKLILTLSILLSLVACKKNGDTPTSDKDYLSVIKDKSWSATFSTPGYPVQYFSFKFKADGTLLSSDTYGDDTNFAWKLVGKHLSLYLSGATMEGDITDDNKFVMTKSTPALPYTFEMTGELNNDADMVLDNTKWQGTATATGSTGTVGMALYFDPGLILDIPSPDNNITFMNQSYVRKGGAFRSTFVRATKVYYYFGIIMPGGKEIRGVIADAEGLKYSWRVTRQ